MEKKVYLRLKSRHWQKRGQMVYIKDIAQLITEGVSFYKLSQLPVTLLRAEDKTVKVIDVMNVVKVIQKEIPEADIQVIGPTQTILLLKEEKKPIKPLLFVLVWLLLFIGAGLAVMNFHEDVSMQEVHIKLHERIVGERVEHPLWLQIPYSIGLGLGMILFFNHIFKKKFNEEPSPMELEMFNYEENIDRYVSVYENPAWGDKKDE
ncbi:stage V sporulation protein AA [Bacillus shivajii]|uniref:stage V sporulation protein AA n=1 Tax=Bacillus shivajii TaxID=1983719 RepID=UPI001CFA66EA|nr:stage V sporulation protein AA [Bacillus shivajii]UCZ54699.1 stage V sporulation protein AA [Bacillus shivajii]